MLCLQKLQSDQLHPVLIHGHCLVFLPSAVSELAKKGWHHCPAICRIILLLIFTVEHEVKALLSLQPPGILVLSSISLETTWHQLNKSISSRPQSLHSFVLQPLSRLWCSDTFYFVFIPFQLRCILKKKGLEICVLQLFYYIVIRHVLGNAGSCFMSSWGCFK